MKLPNTWPWQRKSMRYLMLAALCVTWTGFSFNSSINTLNFSVATITTILLVLFVYGFDDVMDTEVNFSYFKNPAVRWLGIASLAAIALTYFTLGLVSFVSSFSVLVIGTLYSFRHDRDHFNIRLKSFFILKNFLIGVGWGLLVLVGSNHFSYESILITFLFFTAQVTIGSVIRDMDDIEEDQKNKVPTFPIVLGLKNTMVALHGINAFSLLILFAGTQVSSDLTPLWYTWISIVVYRFGLLEIIRQKSMSPYFLQHANILACCLVFAGRVAQLWIF